MPRNPERQRIAKSKWYAENKQEQLVARERRRKERKEWLRGLKNACQNCGEDDPVVLEWHHRDPTQKTCSPYQAIHWGWGMKRILEEIMKCDLLCANCHKREQARLGATLR